MIGNSFIVQIGMAALSVGIIFFYVQPTFSKIGETQDAISQYKIETAKVSEVNSKLSTYVNRINSISSADMRALLTYMPDEVDHVAVTRDIFNMADSTNVYLSGVQYDELQQVYTLGLPKDSDPKAHSFTIEGLGTYEDVKAFLALFEQNNYPLEVHEAQLSATEAGLVMISATVVTYSHSKNI
ncbi:hypothetical protein A3I99_03165 [Candidatus Kaiserbacteria bacterium RIFCSPLOWO2_02_FULL_45_11b]|uniref:Pilus assembly protein PilO n=1 Tax=Candidatus Kaiserbacteria bacterium RIFCSPLOWO2_12_FULL_45_26 TaxID=1798525 RepID=A0A1F6FG17_9BACT|nr:MAG: hypothetical protein A3I99_03165 [Candidatus Kaiserbacteria bacterium RIFCSPLOWO2_02_FULL_45_11b]OGG84800.1 MAG: hypothetical protein A3G90_01825 [Candidatus Kaiserbacteria bacterium RIFCSPLOWO2_12_FULL_45_26]